jgi:hypothetical protein
MSIRYSVNPSNLIAPIKVNSKLQKEYEKHKPKEIDYEPMIFEEIYIPKTKKHEVRNEHYFQEEDRSFIRSTIPRRFYKVKY